MSIGMSIEKMIGKEDAQGFYRLCGISALVLGLSYIVITGLFVLVGAPPREGEALLSYLAGHTTEWWAIALLSVLTDVLFLPIALALYDVLKGVNRNLMLAGSGLLGLFAILDLAVTWPNYASLINLSSSYAAAASDVQKAAYIGAANYASGVLTSHLFSVYALLVPALGILLIGLAMLKKDTFGKITASLGVVTGISGIITVVGPFFMSALSTMAITTSVLTTIWVLLVGYRLYRMG